MRVCRGVVFIVALLTWIQPSMLAAQHYDPMAAGKLVDLILAELHRGSPAPTARLQLDSAPVFADTDSTAAELERVIHTRPIPRRLVSQRLRHLSSAVGRSCIDSGILERCGVNEILRWFELDTVRSVGGEIEVIATIHERRLGNRRPQFRTQQLFVRYRDGQWELLRRGWMRLS